jgi:hypothetical protein
MTCAYLSFDPKMTHNQQFIYSNKQPKEISIPATNPIRSVKNKVARQVSQKTI